MTLALIPEYSNWFRAYWGGTNLVTGVFLIFLGSVRLPTTGAGWHLCSLSYLVFAWFSPSCLVSQFRAWPLLPMLSRDVLKHVLGVARKNSSPHLINSRGIFFQTLSELSALKLGQSASKCLLRGAIAVSCLHLTTHWGLRPDRPASAYIPAGHADCEGSAAAQGHRTIEVSMTSAGRQSVAIVAPIRDFPSAVTLDEAAPLRHRLSH